MQDDLIPAVRLALIRLFYLCGCGANAVFERDAATQALNCIIGRHALDLDLVNFRHTVARRRDEVRELAIVRQQQQAFGVEV